MYNLYEYIISPIILGYIDYPFHSKIFVSTFYFLALLRYNWQVKIVFTEGVQFDDLVEANIVKYSPQSS